MQKIVECVPNFSEGRDRETIDAIAAAIKAVGGVKLLNVDPDADYNRVVVTFVGEPDAVVEAAVAASTVAAQRIDMRTHSGEHPRMGATDVCPFIPVRGVTMEECVELSHRYGRRMAEELGIPVYLYAESAREPKRVKMPSIRKGEYEGLEEKMKDPGWAPDYGKAEFNAKSGATVTGGRFFLIAYNINLGTRDVDIANDIAKRVRESGYIKTDDQGNKLLNDDGKPLRVPGSLKYTQGMGVELEAHGITQVSMNLLRYPETPMHAAFEEVRHLARARGTDTRGSELVGLVPLDCLLLTGRHYMAATGGNSGTATERALVEMAIEHLGLSALAPFEPEERIIEYML